MRALFLLMALAGICKTLIQIIEEELECRQRALRAEKKYETEP